MCQLFYSILKKLINLIYFKKIFIKFIYFKSMVIGYTEEVENPRTIISKATDRKR